MSAGSSAGSSKGWDGFSPAEMMIVAAAREIAINARQVFVIMRQSARSFVDRIDFRTSPGNLGGGAEAVRIRSSEGWLGRGPSVVVTDLGVYRFTESGEMRLESIHPGVA